VDFQVDSNNEVVSPYVIRCVGEELRLTDSGKFTENVNITTTGNSELSKKYCEKLIESETIYCNIGKKSSRLTPP
jgi:hypothetical protein